VLSGFSGTELPIHLPEEAEPDFGVAAGEVEAADQAADFFLGEGGRMGFQLFAVVQQFEEHGGDTFDLASRGGGLLLG